MSTCALTRNGILISNERGSRPHSDRGLRSAPFGAKPLRRIALLGATGSIGTQTLDVAALHPDRFRIVSATANRSAGALKELASQHDIPRIALLDEREAAAHGVPGGMDAILDLVTSPDVDMVVVAVAGVIGLLPTLAAIRAGKAIALASKEVLVAAGEVVMEEVRAHKTLLTPIDSEHSAVFQCIQGSPPKTIEKVMLTASGGPFRGKTRADLAQVTVEQALNHPTWRMGGKITVDSATLMNKGLETIEAKWLFDLGWDQIDVVVHPQSIVHSFVRFHDGSTLAQLGLPDMKLPILYALAYPDRPVTPWPRWDPVATGPLQFESVDHDTFPMIRIAREAAIEGGTTPAAMNAANEEAAAAFLRGEMPFLDLFATVEAVTNRHQKMEPTLDAILEADRWARQEVRGMIA